VPTLHLRHAIAGYLHQSHGSVELLLRDSLRVMPEVDDSIQLQAGLLKLELNPI